MGWIAPAGQAVKKLAALAPAAVTLATTAVAFAGMPVAVPVTVTSWSPPRQSPIQTQACQGPALGKWS